MNRCICLIFLVFLSGCIATEAWNLIKPGEREVILPIECPRYYVGYRSPECEHIAEELIVGGEE